MGTCTSVNQAKMDTDFITAGISRNGFYFVLLGTTPSEVQGPKVASDLGQGPQIPCPIEAIVGQTLLQCLIAC